MEQYHDLVQQIVRGRPVSSAVEELLGEDKLSGEEREELSGGEFVFPKERRYPIHDEAHARNALARVAQHGSPDEQAKVKAAVRKKYPSIEVGESLEDDDEEPVEEADKWIQGAIKHPGALHRQLGVPEGEKIPRKRLEQAAQAGGKLGKRARLAMTLGRLRK
jgi:hypothetical protein